MNKLIGRFAIGLGFCGLLTLSSLANPVKILPPPIVDGKPIVMPVVKKGGRLWYAAPLVSYYRKLPMAYDAATKTVYVLGEKTQIESLLVEDTLFLAMDPKVTTKNMRTGHQYLHHIRPEIERMEKSNTRMAGLTERVYMDSAVEVPNHPWGPDQAQPMGPIIDLDPTGYQGEEIPAHMREGAHAPTHYPSHLPNRLPPRGTQSTASTQQISQSPPASHPSVSSSGHHGVGGPPAVAATESRVQGLEPVPEILGPQGPAVPKMGENQIASSQAKNDVFAVSVAGGQLTISPSGGLLTLKLSQTNIGPVAQSNLGTFSVRCSDGSRAEAVTSRTYLPGKSLKPGEDRSGQLVFRLAPNATPKAVELEGALPLVLPLSVRR